MAETVANSFTVANQRMVFKQKGDGWETCFEVTFVDGRSEGGTIQLQTPICIGCGQELEHISQDSPEFRNNRSDFEKAIGSASRDGNLHLCGKGQAADAYICRNPTCGHNHHAYMFPRDE